MVSLADYVIVSVVLLAIGVYGLISKRNALRMLFAVEIIVNAAVLNVAAFSRFIPASVTGQAIAIYAIAIAAAEAAVGLAIIIVTFRIYRDIDVKELKRLKG